MFELREVSAGYDATTVLRDVSLVVPRSSVVALLGPNGAGKTTLLRVASGLLAPSSGQVLLDGADVTGAAPNSLAGKGVCHVPEGRAVFPALTVRENLLLFDRAGRDDVVERATSAFPRLGERLGQQAGTMSGGEQQMLALARAYVTHPSVILLDEVSMGLAPKIVDEIFEFLHRIAAGGTALLLVEQYVTKALEMADVVYMLSRGKVVYCGEPAELEDEDVFTSYIGADVGHRSNSRIG